MLVDSPLADADAVRHGRFAKRPWQIPWAGWKDVLWRSAREIENDDVLDVAAGVAFWGLFALLPALIALVVLYGLVSNPVDIASQVNRFTVAMPQAARSLVSDQVSEIHRGSPLGLRFGLFASLAVAILGASSGVAAMLRGINKAYDEEETRGWLRVRFLAICFTVGIALCVVLSIGAITLLPRVVAEVGLANSTKHLIAVARWPVMALAVMAGLGLLYRYGPNRTPPKWQWVSLGAVLATIIWTLASLSLGVYADNFGRFNKTYGALGGVAVLALWMFLSALAILLGAELNAELEHQTGEDSTVGPPRPMGERGATVADQIGDFRPPAGDSWRLAVAIRDFLVGMNRPRRGKLHPEPTQARDLIAENGESGGASEQSQETSAGQDSNAVASLTRPRR
jgi:membrane protein